MKRKRKLFCLRPGQRWRGMVLWVFFILLGFSGFSQENKVSFKFVNQELSSVFKELEKADVYKFMFNYDDVKGKKVSLDVKDKKVLEILDIVLKDMPFTYRVDGIMVVIRPKQADSTVKKYVLKGVVVDVKGEPMIGVTVRLDSTSIGTATAVDGAFTLVVDKPKGNLVFSFIGFKAKKVAITPDKDMIVKLEEEVSDLDQVTVIAYGSRKKRELITSVSSIKADDIKEIPAASLETLLQGRMAGVGVNIQSGSPGGGGTNVAVRGYNSLWLDEAGGGDGSPLYVIDGVPVHSFTSPVTGTNTIAEIDPSTIESVEVLKDAASAAIYGSRAANGVILITTKKGRAGEGKFSVNLSYSASVLPEAPTQLGGRAERLYHIAVMRAQKGAYEVKGKGYYKYPTSYEEAANNEAIYDAFWDRGLGLEAKNIIQDSLNPFFNNSTNWYKYIFRTGKILNANIQASGGTERMTYMVGAGYYKETGIMPGSDFSRVNLLTNLSFNSVKKLTVDSRFYLAYTDRSRGATSGDAFKYEGFTVDPNYTSSLLLKGGAVEKKMLQMLNGQVENNTSYRLRANLQLGYEILKGLSISTSFALDYTQANQNQFTPSYLDASGYNESKSSGDIARDMLLSNENLLSYVFSLDEVHNFDLLFGVAYDGSKSWSNGGHGLRGPSDRIEYVGSGFPDLIYDPKVDDYRAMKDYSSSFSETAMVSYFGRLAYNYDKKYLLEVTVRRDGSSVFGTDVRWATFPSVAVGWAFSTERFMKWAWWLNYGKVRASWGRSGSQFAIPYLAQGLMSPGTIFDGVQGMQPEGVINRKLKWEESDQYDFGLDMDFFNYRLSLTIDYYYKYTRALINREVLPGDMYGFNGVQWRNTMAISNEGLELDAKIDILRDTEVKWRTRFNISRNWNRFRKSYSGRDFQEKVIGKPLSGIYLFKDLGMIESDADVPYVFDQFGKKQMLSPEGDEEYFFTKGMRRIADIDGDGQLTDDDLVYAGTTLPRAYGGLVNEIRWKNFDVNILLTYTLGRKMVNSFKYSTLQGRLGGYPVFSNVSLSDFWQYAGDGSKYQTLGLYGNSTLINITGQTTAALENVRYCRLKQLTIGYNLPKRIMKKLWLDGIRIFVTGEDLFLLSNYSGLDPEVTNIGTGFDDGRTYPLARKWTFGLTVNF